MQVFKLYFQVFRSHVGLVIMYLCIFIGIVAGIIVPQSVQQEEEGYVQSTCKIAIFDEDESTLSKGLSSYMKEIHQQVTLADDHKETIQDELYNMNVQGVLCMTDGFEEAFIAGNTEEALELLAISDSIGSIMLTQHINDYLSVVSTYTEAGYTIEDAIEAAEAAMKESVEVAFVDEEQAETASPLFFFYKYLAWIFMAICINTITAVLITMNESGVRERIQCSSYKFSRMNVELLLGVITTGSVMCVLIAGASVVLFGKEMLTLRGVLYFANSFCIMATALAITFLVSKVVTSPQVVSLVSNVISLGMAFVCGVFVPLEFMSEGIVKAAHFLPAYWYVRACEVVDTYQIGDGMELLSYMGMQLLFAVAIICVGVVIANNRRKVR